MPKRMLLMQRPRRPFFFNVKAIVFLLLAVSLLLPLLVIFLPSIYAEGQVTFEVLWRRPLADGYWVREGSWGVSPGLVWADTGDVDGDGIADVAIVPFDWHSDGGGTNNTVQVFRNDGTELWSKSILIDGGRIAIGDIDGDGKGEVIVFATNEDTTNSDALVYALDDDGTQLWLWRDEEDEGLLGVATNYVAFVNVDADPEPEIIGTNGGWPNNRSVYAIDGDGSTIWKKAYNRTERLLVGDVTGDGSEEILHLSAYGHLVRALDKATGDVVWSFSTVNYNSGILGDITGDTIKDVVVVSRGQEIYTGTKLYALRGTDGAELWSLDYSNVWADHPTVPVLEYVDGDAIKDIVLGVEREIRAYKHNGSLLWSYSNPSLFASGCPELFRFDVDRDGEGEIIFFAGKDIYEVSKSGNVTLVGTLPVTDDWGHGRGFESNAGAGKTTEEASTQSTWLWSGDVNNDGFEELVFYEVIDEQFYVTVVTTAAVGNQPPEQPMNASPADGATGLSLTPTLLANGR